MEGFGDDAATWADANGPQIAAARKRKPLVVEPSIIVNAPPDNRQLSERRRRYY